MADVSQEAHASFLYDGTPGGSSREFIQLFIGDFLGPLETCDDTELSHLEHINFPLQSRCETPKCTVIHEY